MKLVTSLLAIFGPVYGGILDLPEYPERVYPAPDGKMWTAWSNWYGCHSMDSDKHDPNDAMTKVDSPWENKEEFCLHSARYLAQSVRYRECTLPDGLYWEGDMEYVDTSESMIGDHRLRERDVDLTDGDVITPGGVISGEQDNYDNMRPPTGDPRESLDGNGFDIGDDTNKARAYVNNVAKPSLRYACDPRVEDAAERCMSMNLCKDYFPEADLQIAYMRVNARLDATNQYKVDTTNVETADLLVMIDDKFPWRVWKSVEERTAFEEMTLGSFDAEEITCPTCPEDETEPQLGPWIYRQVSYTVLADASAEQQKTVDGFDARITDMEAIEYLLITQIKLIIEAEIKRGSEWKEAIPEPYLTMWYDVAICIDDCPVPLPWTSWSCHCQLGSSMNAIRGSNDNPDNLPDCACSKSARFRVQICKDNNADENCRDNVDDLPNFEPDSTCLSCNIYPDNIYNDVTAKYADKTECRNYGWNDKDIDNDYEGINMKRLYHSNFILSPTTSIRQRVDDFLARPDSMGLTQGVWPTLMQIYEEWWENFKVDHPITHDGTDDVTATVWTYDNVEYGTEALAIEQQELGFYGLFVADHLLAQNYLQRHCYFDDHSRSYLSLTPFRYEYNNKDEYAMQFDQCIVSSKWSAYGEYSECSTTCGGGEKQRERNCLKMVMVDGEVTWVEDNSLIGQTCQCEGERIEVVECNTQCCVHWNECSDPSDTDCSQDVHYVRGENWNHAQCEGCGIKTVPSQRRCMCYDNTDEIYYHGSFFDANTVIPSCPVSNTDVINYAVSAYRSTKDIVCNDLPCCGQWTPFGAWSTCDVDCRNCAIDWIPRSKSRVRQCGCAADWAGSVVVDLEAACGGISEDRQYGLCNDIQNGERPDCCPEPCDTWDEWSACELKCREMRWDNFECIDISLETRTRERGCCQKELDNAGALVRFNPVQTDAAFCPYSLLNEVGTCEQDFCCKYSEWSAWDVCETADHEVLECTNDPSVKGYKTRQRHPYCNSKETCPDCWEIEECEIPACPGWAQWAAWSECSCNCGKVGTQARTRTCSGGEDIGSKYCPCNGDPTLQHITTSGGADRCNFADKCDNIYGPNLGNWNANSNFANDVDVQAFHDQDDPGYFQLRRCNTNAPPCAMWRRLDNADPNSELYWSRWGHCDAECGMGEERRHRECVRVFNQDGIGSIELVDDEECDGQPINDLFEARECRVKFCPERFAEQWSNWSSCSSTCQNQYDDLAKRTRARTCAADHMDQHDVCEYETVEHQECPRQPCPKWEQWEEWTPCSQECRGREGFTKRERECSVRALIGHEGCEGENFQYHECNEHIECPMWSSWSAPTECYYIGDPEIGERDRRRFCMHGSFGYACPYERRLQTSPCQVCDIEITRPRIYVRRAQVTLRVSMETNIEWSDDLNDPNSAAYQAHLASLQADLVSNANLGEGQSLVVTGLSLCPPAGCSGRRRRDNGSDVTFADVDISADCDESTEGNCEGVSEDVTNTANTICTGNNCEILETSVNPGVEDLQEEKSAAPNSLISLYLATLCIASLLVFIH